MFSRQDLPVLVREVELPSNTLYSQALKGAFTGVLIGSFSWLLPIALGIGGVGVVFTCAVTTIYLIILHSYYRHVRSGVSYR